MDPVESFIRQSLSLGVDREKIRQQLISVGWTEGQITQSFLKIDNPGIKTASALLPSEPETTKVSFFRTKIALILVVFIIVVGLTGGGVGIFYHFFYRSFNYLTFVPDDTRFYMQLSIRNHPQVQKLLTLTKKLPAGEKLIKEMDKQRVEMFGTAKDPFKEILDLADNEIFLAKISEDEETRSPVNTFEKLVNIVQFKDSKTAEGELTKLTGNENITVSKSDYQSAQILKLDLKSQKKENTSTSFDTGIIPYRITLPLSKSIFATAIDKFILSAEKESDVKKMVDMASGKDEEKMKSVEDDKDHNEIAGNFPKETLVKFYQKTSLDPFSNIFPTSSLPVYGTSYSTTQNSDSGYTVKRGMTTEVKDNGINFTSYQLPITELSNDKKLEHGFLMTDSLASRLPATLDGKTPLFYGELKDVKGTIDDQLKQMEEIAEKSSDESQKKRFESMKKDMDQSKIEFKKEFGIDPDEDIFSWMRSNAAIMFLTSADKSPELMFVFDVADPGSALTRLSKIHMRNYAEESKQKQAAYQEFYQNAKNIHSDEAYNAYEQKIAQIEASIGKLTPEVAEYNGKKIYSLPIYDYDGDLYSMRFSGSGNTLAITFGTGDQSLKDLVDFAKNDSNVLSKNDKWQEQFASAPKTVGGIWWFVPENIMNVVDYYLKKSPQTMDYVNSNPEYKQAYEDGMIAARGYLKAFSSLGGTTTLAGQVFISNTFINVRELPQEEKTKVEEAVDRLLKLNSSSSSSRSSQSRDEDLKYGVGMIATALEAYYTGSVQARYPDTLGELVTSGDLRQLPRTPSDEDYGYITCNNNQEAVVYGKLGAGTYFVWDSKIGSAYDSKSTTAPTDCSIKKPEDIVLGISATEEKEGLLDVIKADFKSHFPLK